MTRPQILYSAFQGLALLTSFLLRQPSPLAPLQRLGVLAAAVFGGGVGAKLPFVVLSKQPFFSASAWFSDGKTILAGFAGGYAAIELVKRLMGIREKTGDALAIPLAAGVAVGRWGCFFNGCCGAPLVPPIESAFHATMAVVLWRLRNLEAFRWQLIKLYLIAYCVFRFAVEFIRSEPRLAWGLTGYQWGAAAMAAILVALWLQDERLKRTDSPKLAVDAPIP